jgi:IrrE N-terminal-like domain
MPGRLTGPQRSALSVSGVTLIDVQAGRRPRAHLVWWRGRELSGCPAERLAGYSYCVCSRGYGAVAPPPRPCQPPGRTDFFNGEHIAARRASDITHELAHGLVLHRPVPALDDRGCRAWNTAIEYEASYLGGALLLPGKAARWVAKCGMSPEYAAERFGCSIEMVRWRCQVTLRT